MAKFTLMKPRMKNMRGRVPLVRVDPDSLEHELDPDRIQRKAWYRSPRWAALKKAQMESRCWCRCGRFATVLDHLVGHDDEQADRVAAEIGVPLFGDWVSRFWGGPFVSLCETCHNSKTWHEQRGRLGEWLVKNKPKRRE